MSKINKLKRTENSDCYHNNYFTDYYESKDKNKKHSKISEEKRNPKIGSK